MSTAAFSSLGEVRLLACVTLVTEGVTLVTNSSFIHCAGPKKRGYCECDGVSTVSPHLVWTSQSHVLHTHIPLSISPCPPHPPPRAPCLPLGLHILDRSPYSFPLYLSFLWVDRTVRTFPLSPCRAKTAKPSLLRRALCLFRHFSFLGYRDV